MPIQALLTFVILDVGFRVFGFPRMFQFAERWGRRAVDVDATSAVALQRALRRVSVAVRTANRYYYRRRLDCLPRAMATYLLLRGRGVPATLHIGVKRHPFGAHAWVECLGEVLDDSPDDWQHEPYVPILSTGESAVKQPEAKGNPESARAGSAALRSFRG